MPASPTVPPHSRHLFEKRIEVCQSKRFPDSGRNQGLRSETITDVRVARRIAPLQSLREGHSLKPPDSHACSKRPATSVEWALSASCIRSYFGPATQVSVGRK